MIALRVVVWLLAAGVGCGVIVPPQAWGASGGWPLSGPVVRGFDPPDVAWGAGHRGVDVAGEPDAGVRSPADGVVTFAGSVAGKPVVVVTHGDLRTTLEPVVASVPVGSRVARGDVVGHLRAGHAPCPADACLHWGLKRGEEYLDPMSLVADAARLLPDAAASEVERRAEERARTLAAVMGGGGGSGVLAAPVAGRLGSGFGPRFHPIFKEWRLHAGIDLSAPCGTPLYASADATVAHVGHDASGGWRLVLAHGPVEGVELTSVYLHAQGYRVQPGQRVGRGEFVGTVGSTGWSTGCHLHFAVKADGRHVDPQRWL